MICYGVSGANGIAIGKAYIYREQEVVVDHKIITVCQSEEDIGRLQQAAKLAKQQLLSVRDRALTMVGPEQAAIFDAHIAMVEDQILIDEITTLIRQERITATHAIERVSADYVALFAAMDDEYMRERAGDIKDVCDRLLRNILGVGSPGAYGLDSEVILIAHDLTPSATATLNPTYIKGIAVDIGGKTSHTAILAKTLEIPAVLGLGDITERVKDGDLLVVDGTAGAIVIAPTQEELATYLLKVQKHNQVRNELKKLVNMPATTTDGRTVEIAANIGQPEDVGPVIENGGDGVGLYRTEFLYMDKEQLPDEEEQFQAYRSVAEKLGGKPLIIRTLDVGGDKQVKCISLPREQNPFLGWRAIRICLSETELFKTQLKAILRASAYGNVLIMYPMISDVSEVREANRILAAAKQELRTAGVPFAENIPVGIMVEIPSAALTADIIVTEVDFFSVGTNDLCQYTLAVDRMNNKISALYQPLHPAILRLVKNVIDISHKHGKFTGMCGEMAGDPLAVIILLGLGLDEFSMSASSILKIKKIVRGVSFAQARQIANEALTMATQAEIAAFTTAKLEELQLDCE